MIKYAPEEIRVSIEERKVAIRRISAKLFSNSCGTRIFKTDSYFTHFVTHVTVNRLLRSVLNFRAQYLLFRKCVYSDKPVKREHVQFKEKTILRNSKWLRAF